MFIYFYIYVSFEVFLVLKGAEKVGVCLLFTPYPNNRAIAVPANWPA